MWKPNTKTVAESRPDRVRGAAAHGCRGVLSGKDSEFGHPATGIANQLKQAVITEFAQQTGWTGVTLPNQTLTVLIGPVGAAFLPPPTARVRLAYFLLIHRLSIASMATAGNPAGRLRPPHSQDS
jgi:hypothetical protein